MSGLKIDTSVYIRILREIGIMEKEGIDIVTHK
jgi:hypothetical protein